MGNYKFKLSDMIPNAWFYKLKDMNKAKKQSKNSNKKVVLSQPRRSTYNSIESVAACKFSNSSTNPIFSDTLFLDYPRKSLAKRSKRRKTVYKPSSRISTSPFSKNSRNACSRDDFFPSSESSDNEYYESPLSEKEYSSIDDKDVFNKFSSWSSSYRCRVISSTTDIIIDVSKESSISKNNEKLKRFDSFTAVQLRPINTKPANLRNENSNDIKQSRQEQNTLSVKRVKEGPETTQKQKKTSRSFRITIPNSTDFEGKLKSPKILTRKIQTCARKSVASPKQEYKDSGNGKNSFSKSFVFLKSSFNPLKDFSDSMMEMILENEISASKDLEELLGCYLLLNSDEYHDVIVKAFEQIWFEMASLRL